MKTISTQYGAIKHYGGENYLFEFDGSLAVLNGTYFYRNEQEAKSAFLDMVERAKAPTREERPEMKACALLLAWVEEGERGMPNPDTLADAVTFARLALK